MDATVKSYQEPSPSQGEVFLDQSAGLSVPATQNSTWMDKNETEKGPLARFNEMCSQSGAKATFELTGGKILELST